VIGFGGDYNPEQTDPATWAEDDRLMRRARVTTATVGVFSWALLEPAEGRYEFGWLDDAIGRLHDNGVTVTLATPTASPPPWFTLAYPDALPVTADGTRLVHGSRDTYCAAAPAYRAAALRITSELAGRYADHPAVTRWHIHNEYGTICWCDHAAGAFRRWLRDRYGSLDALNDAWSTSFWSQRYSAWEQILPPRATQYLANPAQSLDFKRFWSDELLAAYTDQRDEVRGRAPAAEITTNFILPSWQPIDMWRWADQVDVVAVDHYLDTTDEADGHADIAFAADRARSLAGGRPWVLMEHAPNPWPGRTVLDSLGYVARGADDVLFFQWRASRGGAEMYHPALVPHAGEDSRIFREAVELGEILERIGEVEGTRVHADVAILYDPDSWWALEATSLVSYLGVVRAVHRMLWRAGVTTDFARPRGDDLSGYRLVVAPATYIMAEPGADAIRRYVRKGGQLVATFLSGIADESHRVRVGGYPGALPDILGVRVEEFHPLPSGTSVALDDGSAATVWSERLRADGAEVVASYADGGLAGLPAITRHALGDGAAWYLSTMPGSLAGVLRAAGVEPVLAGLPAGVDAVRRGRYLFVFNHRDEPVTMPVTGSDLLTGRAVTTLAPSAVAILRQPN
jgi:beta-galactosidase